MASINVLNKCMNSYRNKYLLEDSTLNGFLVPPGMGGKYSNGFYKNIEFFHDFPFSFDFPKPYR